MTKRGWFDAEAFFQALNAHREARKLTWKQVASQSGVSASTLTRMAQGKRPDVDSLAALVSWSGLEVDKFIRPGREITSAQAEPLAMISTYLRTSPHLTPDAADALDDVIKVVYERLRKG